MSNCSCPACTERRDLGRPRASTGTPSKDFAEGRDLALAHSAMVAWDMGHPDVRLAINGLIPDGSNAIPMDDERFQRRASTGRAARPARSLVHEAFALAVKNGGNGVCGCDDTTSWHQTCCDTLTEMLEADRAAR